MKDILVREARSADRKELSKIFSELLAHHNEALPEMFRIAGGAPRKKDAINFMLSDTSGALFVAECHGNIIGFIDVIIKEPQDTAITARRRYAEVHGVAVTSRYRRCGAGRLLMEKAEQWALRQKLAHIELHVWDFNKGAIAFYQSLGYSVRSHIMYKPLK